MRKVSKIAAVQKYQLPIEILKEGNYFTARCPDWSDCYAQGKTIDEATAEIIAVTGSLIELYQEEDLKIPLSRLEQSSGARNKISFTVPVFTTA